LLKIEIHFVKNQIMNELKQLKFIAKRAYRTLMDKIGVEQEWTNELGYAVLLRNKTVIFVKWSGKLAIHYRRVTWV